MLLSTISLLSRSRIVSTLTLQDEIHAQGLCIYANQQRQQVAMPMSHDRTLEDCIHT